jgi:hypothetical protein
MTWTSVKEYAKAFNDNIKTTDRMWEAENLSDHKPVFATYGDIKLVSWNILNRIYTHHQLNDNGEHQGLKDHPMVQPDFQDDREYLLMQKIDSYFTDDTVVLLQEVSVQMFELLIAKYPRRFYALPTSAKNNNYNVTLVPLVYNLHGILTDLEIFDLEYKTTRIWLTNVHVKFGGNCLLRDSLLEIVPTHPMIVAGDFNASLRIPPPLVGDSLVDIYADESRFKFYNNNPRISHLNLFMNTIVDGKGDEQRQIDLFDHFLLICSA